MEHIGTFVIYIIMACAVIGAVAVVIRPESELGQEFNAGIHSIGPIFIPVAGIMAAIPFISSFISQFISPLFLAMGADAGIAGPIFIASDLGGYQLAQALSQSPEEWNYDKYNHLWLYFGSIYSLPTLLCTIFCPSDSNHDY